MTRADPLRFRQAEALYAEDRRNDDESSHLLRPTGDAEHDVPKIGVKVFIVIEGRAFMRECLRIGLALALRANIRAYSSVGDYQQDEERGGSSVIFLSWSEMDGDLFTDTFCKLLEIDSSTPIIVIGPSRLDFVNAAVSRGAKGYVPLTTKFDVAVAATHIVLAGGTYVPMDCLPSHISRNGGRYSPVLVGKSSPLLTARELSVVGAIQQAKSNKAIANCLDMTENTVKVHIRHIMTKLKAKNRTEIAMMSKKRLFGTADELSLN
jgi:DNA-binding NarL/FixJ family response regulator